MTLAFDAATPEEAIAAFVRAEASADALLALLREQHPLYAGRSANETTRIRGFTLAAFERTGLPQDALPFVLEELQSGHDPYLVAAAARALRGGAADPRFIPFLRKAEENIRYQDAPVTFETYKPTWPVARSTTAAKEIRKTLDRIGDGGDCCEVAFPPERSRKPAALDLALEDQDGRAVDFNAFFRGKWSVVAFFYSRCDNPAKCSFTIAELARLQQEIASGPLRGGVRIAAITYDPAYDLPPRMKRFGEDRGVRFDDDVRFLRAPHGLDELRARFDLGVNFIGPLVNRHRIELYVLDARANIVAAFTRMQWSAASVAAELERLDAKASREWKLAGVSLPAVLLALLPKCPLCLGAYFTAFGLGGLQFLAARAWTIPAAALLLLLHLALVYRRTRRTGNALALLLSLVGAGILLAGIAAATPPPIAFAGAALIVAAALASSGVTMRVWLPRAFFWPGTAPRN